MISGMIRMMILGITAIVVGAVAVVWWTLSPAQRLAVLDSLRAGNTASVEEQASRDASRLIDEGRKKAEVEVKKLASEIADEAAERLREEAAKATREAKEDIRKETKEALERAKGRVDGAADAQAPEAP